MVHIQDFDSGIDEKVKAIPEEFLGRGGRLAAVLSMAQSVISELQKAGRLPKAQQQEADKSVLSQALCPKCGQHKCVCAKP